MFNLSKCIKRQSSYKLGTILGVINTVCQIILVVIGFQALNVWYDETRGLDKYNVARDGLVAIYNLRDVLALVKTSEINAGETVLRGGVTFGSEGEEKYVDKGHPMDSAFRERLGQLRIAIDEYYNVIPKIEVVLGEKIRDDLNTMNFGAEYYYYVGIDLYNYGCHPLDLKVQADSKNSDDPDCIEGLEKFNNDEMLDLFYFRFNRINMALRDVLKR